MIEELLSKAYLGNTLGQYFTVFVILLVTFLGAKILFFILKTYMAMLTKKTKTRIDDIVLDIIEEPLVFLLLVIGVYLAMSFLTLGEGVQKFMDNVYMVLLTLSIAYFFYKMADVLIAEYLVPLADKSKSKLDDQLVPILRKTVKTFIILLTIVIVLNNFGYNITSLLAGLGIGGLAFALAAQDTIANMFGSLTIFTDKPFEVQDKVKVNGVSGVVQEVGLRSVRVKTYDGTLVTIPNKDVANSVVENVSYAVQKKVALTLGLVYDTTAAELEKAIRLLKEIFEKHPKVVKDNFRAHFVNFNASSLDIEASYWIDSADFNERMETINSINLEIKKQFDKNKLEFAYPTQTLYLKR